MKVSLSHKRTIPSSALFPTRKSADVTFVCMNKNIIHSRNGGRNSCEGTCRNEPRSVPFSKRPVGYCSQLRTFYALNSFESSLKQKCRKSSIAVENENVHVGEDFFSASCFNELTRWL